jgi:lipopolysaccharide export system protein LptA
MNRRVGSLIFFCLLCFSPVILLIVLGDIDREAPTSIESVNSTQESRFKELQYFQSELSEQKTTLYADHAILQEGTAYYQFFSPRGQIFRPDGPKDYKGDIGHFWKDKEVIELDKNVEVLDGITHISSDWARYEMANDYVLARGSVKTWRLNATQGDQHFIDSDVLHSWPKQQYSIYEGHVKGRLVPQQIFREKTFYEAQRIETKILEKKIDLMGDVFLTRGPMQARSVRGKFLLEGPQNRLERFFLYENVRLEEKLPDQTMRKAFGEQLEGIIARAEYILTGYPRVYQAGDIIKGTKIVLFEHSDLIEVDSAQTDFKVR